MGRAPSGKRSLLKRIGLICHDMVVCSEASAQATGGGKRSFPDGKAVRADGSSSFLNWGLDNRDVDPSPPSETLKGS